jgi:hypothetical protein
MQAHDRRVMGMDADDAVDAALAKSRRAALDERLNRDLARDRNVRFTMTAADRRYPDRRAAEAG